MSDSSVIRLGKARVGYCTKDHTDYLPTHTFMHKWSDPMSSLLSRETSSPIDGCPFTVPLKTGG